MIKDAVVENWDEEGGIGFKTMDVRRGWYLFKARMPGTVLCKGMYVFLFILASDMVLF